MPLEQGPAAPADDAALHELRLVCPRSEVETTGDALQALQALSITTEDANAGTDAEDAQYGEPGLTPQPGWAQTRISALFASADEAQQAARLLVLQDFFAHGSVLAIAPVPQQDWVGLTQSRFDAVCITPEFWVVPSWHQVPETARHVIRLDPGMAFGTGTHPTTAMCLRWIAAHPPRGLRVLDYGCGSGILAIAAALYGAARVEAVDIDAAAVHATTTNAAANAVDIRVGPPDLAQGKYRLVMANILAQPLKTLAPVLSSHLAAHGWLLLSGLLQDQAHELQQAYAPWLSLDLIDSVDDWIMLAGQRPLGA